MKRKPNVLLILGDQHRYDCLGCTGTGEVLTPALDALAQHATLYENAYCVYPVCTPSRYSILSGLYPHQHGALSNHSTLAGGHAAFPRALRAAGYRTACVGKMHFAPTYLDVGFYEMLLSEQDGPGRMEDDYHAMLMDKGALDCFDIMDQRGEYRSQAGRDYWELFGSGVSDLPEELHSTTWIGENAVRQLQSWDAEQSNLLMVGFIKPHHPFDPPQRWLDLYDPEKLSLPAGWSEALPPADAAKQPPYFPNEPMNASRMKRIAACYYACISQMDHWIGQMIQVLKDKGLYDDTVIVYTSDHGEYLGFHHMLLKFNYMYDPLVRVPLLVKPAGQTRGERVARPVSNHHLAPSILQWAGVAQSMPGTPLDQAEDEYVFAELKLADGWNYMVRDQRYKLMIEPAGVRLFDLAHDPQEREDVSAQPEKQEVVRRMYLAFVRWLSQETMPLPYLQPDAPQCRNAAQARRDPATLTAYFAEQFVPTPMSPAEKL